MFGSGEPGLAPPAGAPIVSDAGCVRGAEPVTIGTPVGIGCDFDSLASMALAAASWACSSADCVAGGCAAARPAPVEPPNEPRPVRAHHEKPITTTSSSPHPSIFCDCMRREREGVNFVAEIDIGRAI